MFKSVEWPETCYLQEAVYWLAFGRVSEVFYQDEYSGDYGDARLGEEAMQLGEVVSQYDEGFTELEFRSAGIKDIDYERYLGAPSRLTWHTPHETDVSPQEYIAHWEAVTSIGEENDDNEDQRIWRESSRAAAQRHVDDYHWRKRQEEVFEPQIERARITVSNALVNGELSAFGLIERRGTVDKPFEKVVISSTQWRMNFKWFESELTVGGQTFKAVQVETQNLLKVFPKPQAKPLLSTKVDIYPGVAILSNDKDEPSFQERLLRGRGRPKAAGGVVERAVRYWAQRQIELHGQPRKREAFIQEAIDFSIHILGHEASRSAVQSWIKDLLQPSATERATAEYSAGK